MAMALEVMRVPEILAMLVVGALGTSGAILTTPLVRTLPVMVVPVAQEPLQEVTSIMDSMARMVSMASTMASTIASGTMTLMTGSRIVGRVSR